MRLKLLLASCALKGSYDSSSSASVLAESMKSVRVGISLAGLPLFLEVRDPMVFTNRRPLVWELIEAHQALIEPLPRPCDEARTPRSIASNYDDASDSSSRESLAALVECWEPAVLQQVESHLIKQELLSQCSGEYWPLQAFYRGEYYSNEVNRLVLSVVTSNPDQLFEPAIRLLRTSVAHNTANGYPLAAAASTLAQILYECGREPRHREESLRVLQDSLLAVPGHALRHAHLSPSNSAMYRLPTATSSSSSLQGQHDQSFRTVPWREAVNAAKVTVVCVATRRTLKLRALVRSAVALGHSVTVLGLGQKWPGFGLKVKLFAEYLESLSAEDENNLVLFVDAYDVLLLEPFRHLKRRFLNQGAAVLFSGEIAPSPDSSTSLVYNAVDGANQRGPLPYLNSGSILGLAKDLRVVLRDVIADLLHNHAAAIAPRAGSSDDSSSDRVGDRVSDSIGESASRPPFDLPMDVEDQRWFTRYYLRRKLTEAHEVSLNGDDNDAKKNFDNRKYGDTTETAVDGNWRTFVALDRFGDLFQTTHETIPAQYRLGAVGSLLKNNSSSNGSGLSTLHKDAVKRCASSEESCRAHKDSDEEKTRLIAQRVEEGYASQPTGAFGGAGLVWNTATQRAPILLHGNDWKERTFNALGKGLQAGGWPPAPFWLETSLPSLPGDPPGDPSVDDAYPTSDAEPTVTDADPAASTLLGDVAPGHGLWARWTDPFLELLQAYQDRHRSWLPHEDCNPLDHKCMSDRLRIFLGQRMVKHELQHMNGDVMPLLPLLRGAPGLHSHFWTDLLMRGVLDHDASLVANATTLLRVAVESRPKFAPASHLLAEILVRFGAEGNGATRFDQSEARKVLLKSVLAFDAFSEAERAAATGAAESGVAAQCAALACKTWPSASSSSFDRNISPSSPSLREDETDTDVVVRVVTVASEPRPELTAMKSAARQLGLGPVSVLGLGLPWPGLGQKVVLLHDWLKRSLRDGSVHASDLVLFLDAFDVLLLPSCTRHSLLRRFQVAQVPLLFGAEAASSPDLAAALIDSGHSLPFSPSSLPTAATSPLSRSDPSYLNSGTMLGPAGTLMCVLEEVYADMVLSGHSEPADSNDQRWFTRYRLRHGPFCAPIDTSSNLFLTLHGLASDDLVVHAGGAVTLKQNEASGDGVNNYGPLLVHGNGEDTLFRSIVRQVRRAGWPRSEEDNDVVDVGKHENTPAAAAAAIVATANDNKEVVIAATGKPATSMQAIVKGLKFDKAFNSASLCPSLSLASTAATAFASATTERAANMYGVMWENVTTAVEVNSQLESFTVKFDEAPVKVATAFVLKHGVLRGAGCGLNDVGRNSGDSSDEAAQCMTDLLAFQVDRLRFIRELEAMSGTTFDLLGFFQGRNYSRFLNNMLLRGVLRDRPDLRLNATRVLRCALHNPHASNRLRPSDDSSSSNNMHFVAAAYSLVDVLHQIALAETNEDAILDALAVLKASIEALLPETGSSVAISLSLQEPVDMKQDRNYDSHRTSHKLKAGNRLHVVTVATEVRPELKALKRSVELSLNTVDAAGLRMSCIDNDTTTNHDCSRADGINADREASNTFTVLGLDETWGGLGSKVVWLRKHLATLPPQDLVVFTDAYDVLATSAAAHTVEMFRSFHAAIVFGCEVEAAPDAAVAHFLCARPSTPASLPSLLHSQQDSCRDLPPLPHLNSGLFVGSAGAVLTMLDEVTRDVAAHHSSIAGNGDVDDQRFFWRFYLRHRHTVGKAFSGADSSVGETIAGKNGFAAVALDTTGTLFHSFHGVNSDALVVSDTAKGEIFSALSNTTPAFVHGNAGGRTALARATRALQEPGAWLFGSL